VRSAVDRHLEHRTGAQAGPDPPRRHGAVHAHDLAAAVDPVQVERETHAEGVDGPGAREQQAPVRRPAAKREADEPLAEGAGHEVGRERYSHRNPVSLGVGCSGLTARPGIGSGAL
jgi:hypothetical protein